MGMSQRLQSEHGNKGAFSRRELARTVLAGAALGLGGVIAYTAPARAELTAGQKASLSKVLIERLFNTRYEINGEGVLTVYPQDEVWASGGGAQHQAWLFDAITGLKADPQAALEQTVATGPEHAGIDSSIDASDVSIILQKAEAAGLLDELNLAYWVLKEKIHVETAGAYDTGVEIFSLWVAEHETLDPSTKGLVQDLVMEYLSLPATNQGEGWY